MVVNIKKCKKPSPSTRSIQAYRRSRSEGGLVPNWKPHLMSQFETNPLTAELGGRWAPCREAPFTLRMSGRS